MLLLLFNFFASFDLKVTCFSSFFFLAIQTHFVNNLNEAFVRSRTNQHLIGLMGNKLTK